MLHIEWWHDAAYGYMWQLAASGFAWEYLRRNEEFCCFPSDPDTAADLHVPLWAPRVHPNAIMLLPVRHETGTRGPRIRLAHLDGLELRRAADGWHRIWRVDGIAHQLWLPHSTPDTAAFYDLRSHAARRFWRSVEGHRPRPKFRIMPAQLRQ